MLKIFFSTIICSLLYFSLSFGTSISELTPYPAFCQLAADNDKVFESFKSNADYRVILEHVPYEKGLEYLNIIVKDYPDLIPYFDLFRENDAIGNPTTYWYGEYGLFSPTTLRYIKSLGDLQKKFGDLKKLNIVEIGPGYGGLCKIVSILGFKSYTVIDLPQVNALTRKYLERQGVSNVIFIDSTDLQSLQSYDLVISNYAFSEIDREEQAIYLDRVIKSTPNGYMTMNFISSNSLKIEELLSILLNCGRKGKVEQERPLTGFGNLLLTWKEPQPPLSPVSNPKIFDPKSGENAVSYILSGGRFGDNLLAYLRAKWVAYKYSLPFLYHHFPYADQLAMHHRDQSFNEFSFAKQIIIRDEKQISQTARSSFLLIIPYSPECELEYLNGHPNLLYTKLDIDWDDHNFRKEIEECLMPLAPVQTLELPNDMLTLAIHIRTGGGVESLDYMRLAAPLKFPPDAYFLKEINRVAEIFKDIMIYVYIFTDSNNPQAIVNQYSAALNNPRLCFDCRKEANGPYQNVFEDFFSIGKFDCLICGISNFSLMASKLAQQVLVITPTNYAREGDEITITETELIFRAKANP